MLRISLYSVGKLPHGAFSEIGDKYSTFLKKYADVSWTTFKTSKQLLHSAPKNAILLDEKGDLMDSHAFSELLEDWNDRGETISFILGGAEGFSAKEKEPFRRLSLSPMTTTHDLALLFLLEQLFRGLSIAHGSAYHKEEIR